jgi:hypothetical protein
VLSSGRLLEILSSILNGSELQLLLLDEMLPGSDMIMSEMRQEGSSLVSPKSPRYVWRCCCQWTIWRESLAGEVSATLRD